MALDGQCYVPAALLPRKQPPGSIVWVVTTSAVKIWGQLGKIKIFVLKYNLGFFVLFVSWSSLIIALRQWNWQPSTRWPYRRKHESSWMILLRLRNPFCAVLRQLPSKYFWRYGYLGLFLAARSHWQPLQHQMSVFPVYVQIPKLQSVAVVPRCLSRR